MAAELSQLGRVERSCGSARLREVGELVRAGYKGEDLTRELTILVSEKVDRQQSGITPQVTAIDLSGGWKLTSAAVCSGSADDLGNDVVSHLAAIEGLVPANMPCPWLTVPTLESWTKRTPVLAWKATL